MCRKELGDSKPGMEAFQGRVPIMMWQLLDPAAHDLGIPEAQREWTQIIITHISKHSDVTNKPECLPRAARPHRTHPEYSAGIGGEYTSKCSRGRSPCTAPQTDGVGGAAPGWQGPRQPAASQGLCVPSVKDGRWNHNNTVSVTVSPGWGTTRPHTAGDAAT